MREQASWIANSASRTSVEAVELERGGAACEPGVAPNNFVDEMPGTAHEIFEMEVSVVKFDAPSEQPVARSDSDAPDPGESPSSVDNLPSISPSDLEVSPPDSNASLGDLEISPAQTTGSSTRPKSKHGKT